MKKPIVVVAVAALFEVALATGSFRSAKALAERDDI